MGRLEILATLLGVINIVLLVRRSAWNYAFGLAMVALYAPIFLHARLYSDALLQVFFFLVQLYGWWNWLRGKATSGDVIVERLSVAGGLRWLAIMLPAWAAWSYAMHRWTDTLYPYWDGAVASFSVAAQLMLARRLIENWPLWILIDVVAIGLYLARGLLPTAALYLLFLFMSAWGWLAWTRAERMQHGVPA